MATPARMQSTAKASMAQKLSRQPAAAQRIVVRIARQPRPFQFIRLRRAGHAAAFLLPFEQV